MGLAERIFVGLPPACSAIDAEAAEHMRGHVDAVHGAVGLLGEPGTAASGGIRERWHSVLRVLAGRDTVPGESAGGRYDCCWTTGSWGRTRPRGS